MNETGTSRDWDEQHVGYKEHRVDLQDGEIKPFTVKSRTPRHLQSNPKLFTQYGSNDFASRPDLLLEVICEISKDIEWFCGRLSGGGIYSLFKVNEQSSEIRDFIRDNLVRDIALLVTALVSLHDCPHRGDFVALVEASKLAFQICNDPDRLDRVILNEDPAKAGQRLLGECQITLHSIGVWAKRKLENKFNASDEPLKDGPIPDTNDFRWEGKVYPGLTKKPWRLLSYVWASEDRRRSYAQMDQEAEMAEKVWEDRACDFRGDRIKQAACKITRFFKKNGISLRCEHDGSNYFVQILEVS